MKRKVIFGPPGTGKTTKLLNILEEEIDSGISPSKIAFVSFTRKAVYEAIDRVVDRFDLNKQDLHYFKTLHALAYHQLGLTKNDILGYQHLKELGHQLGLRIVAKIDMEEGLPPAGSELGSKYLFIGQLARAKMITLKEAWEFVNDYEVMFPDVQRFDEAYIKYKNANSVIDFTDMIETFVESGKPPKIDVLIVDEAQDLFPLQWEIVKKLEANAKRVYVAGDDDQCQPGNTMIETTRGKKRLSLLNPETDRLLTYSKVDDDPRITQGFYFKKAKRDYQGKLFTFYIDGKVVQATSNHKWLVKRLNKNKDQQPIELQSGDISSKIMALPVYTKGHWVVEWLPIDDIKVEDVQMPVYSLDVEKHHTYIANDVITCNSIYNWSGANINIFLNLEGEKEVLNQSYRLPKNIFNLANSITAKIRNRKSKNWKPTDKEGAIQYYGDPMDVDLHDQKSWFLLARNVYLLERWKEIAEAQGIVYTLRNRSSVKADEATAIQHWEQLRKGQSLDIESIRNVYQFLRSKEGIARGFKKLNNATKSAYTLEELKEEGGLLTDKPWFEALSMIPNDQRLYYRSVLARKEGLFQPPRVHINTIHGVKGGEADHVAILTDMAYKSFKALNENPDDEHRCFYVGITRAKEKVFIIHNESRFYYSI